MTVREVFLKWFSGVKENRNNWTDAPDIESLKHCYVTQIVDTTDKSTFTLFLGDARIISLVRPMSNSIGINIDSNCFIFAEAFRVVDMQTHDEFVINKDGIVDDKQINRAKAVLNSLYGECKGDDTK